MAGSDFSMPFIAGYGHPAFPARTGCGIAAAAGIEISRFPDKERRCVLGSLTTPDRAVARDNATVRVAFRDPHLVGVREKVLSRLNTQPTHSPADASPCPSRDITHGSGPM
jgi:hypothetical protein